MTDFVYTTKTLKKITLRFTVQESKVKVTRSSVETVPCPLGFVRVCNEAVTTLESIAICPVTEASEEEAECSCQQKLVVEEAMQRGVSPLGINSQQCFQVPAEMVANTTTQAGTGTADSL